MRLDNKMIEFYTRNQDGKVETFDSAEEAIKSFISYDGYRLSIDVDGKSIHIYRDALPVIKDGIDMFYKNQTNKEYEAKILVMGNYNE